MVDNKAPAPKTDPVVEKSEAEAAYEARAKAYSEGQEQIEAKRLEDAKPYEELSKLVDEHSEAARKIADAADEKSKKK